MQKSLKLKNNYVVTYIFILVIGMLCLSFISVPLYDLFCRVTGYAGTTQKSTMAPGSRVGGNLYKIRFDANVSKNLDWKFIAPQEEINIKYPIRRPITIAKTLNNPGFSSINFCNVSIPKINKNFDVCWRRYYA